jgi:hypothetical protein
MTPIGISGEGLSAEEAFRSITGATVAATASVGDAMLDGRPVEVKKASANTLNQVRAVKYLPLVAYHQPTQQWYVVPAHDVVRLVSGKSRGQHTENPFESATVSIAWLQDFSVGEDELREAVLNALDSADEHPRIRDAMAAVLEQSRSLASESIDLVRTILREEGLISDG